MNRITRAFLCMLLLCTQAAHAAHLTSAELRYEYSGTGNDYNVYLTVVRNCTGIALSANENIQVSSSCGSPLTVTLPQVSLNTYTNYCPAFPNQCTTPGAIYPAFQVGVYTGVVTLPPCADWKISYSGGSRLGTITNLQAPGGQNLYMEAFLDNSTAINSSPIVATKPYHITANTGLNTFPYQAFDMEGDNLVYEWDTPRTTGNAAINYSSGYSFASPFGAGGVLSHYTTAQTLQMKTPMIGMFSLALKIKDYRNGQHVGTTVRDFVVVSLNGTPLTNPLSAPGNVMTYSTCPGMSNSVTLNFQDSTGTDTVITTVTPPVIPGFTFAITSTSTAGSGSVTISWTTPASFNPATLPAFVIPVEVKDNGCPAFGLSHYAILVNTAQCLTDSVWAGDANGDYTVNVYDPLAIAVAYGQTGALRVSATTLWQAEYCLPWANSFVNTVNMKHADCNGDGTVDNLDLTAVTTNWGLVHLKPSVRAKVTGVPDLEFDLTGITATPGASVSVPIKLGVTGSEMNDMYGIATGISIGGITLAAPPTITYPSSWIGNSSNTLTYVKTDASSTGDIAWAYSRKNHQNVSGQGTIAHINFTIPASATAGQQITFSFADPRVVDKDMNEITAFNANDNDMTIATVSVGQIPGVAASATIIPNPSGKNAVLQLTAVEQTSVNIVVTDVTGKQVDRKTVSVVKGMQHVALPSSLSSGVYLINVSDDKGASNTVKWIRD